MTLAIKICGLSEPRSLDAALDAGADMVGFVFFPPSPRNVALETARDLADRVERRAHKVVLTVDADDALLGAIIEAVDPDVLQLHGRESPARVAAIRARFGLPVMRAIAIATAADLAAVDAFDAVADRLLLDARAPADATRPGGNGAAFDWRIARDVRARRPWLLAGGLTGANVADAIAATSAPGLDVSSGVEAAPGRKDPALIATFIARARMAAERRHAERLGTTQAIG